MTLLLLTALDVIATKLSVQRNGLSSPPLVETEATPAPKDQVEEYSTEDVIEWVLSSRTGLLPKRCNLAIPDGNDLTDPVTSRTQV